MTRIFVVDDDPAIRSLLQVALSSHGYEVITANDGAEALPLILRSQPDLVLTDVSMPKMDGNQLCNALRSDARTAFTPVIFLSGNNSVEDKVASFGIGADDYVTKPVSMQELFARIGVQLRKVAERGIINSLTRLPGGGRVEDFLKMMLNREGVSFAVLYVDLDNFKAYNDYYGFVRGNQVIILLADILREIMSDEDGEYNFTGHIGGDDFVLVTTYERAEAIGRQIISEFDSRVRDLYDPPDLEQGYIVTRSRQGNPKAFKIISVSIGVVNNKFRRVTSLLDIGEISAEVKRAAKRIKGSSFYVDKRRLCHLSTAPTLCYNPPVMTENHILIVSDDLVAAKMAGPGVRNWELARALVRAGQRVTLASPGAQFVPPTHDFGDRLTLIGYERDGDNGPLRAVASSVDLIFAHGFTLHFLPFLREVGKPLAVDVYNPFTLEDLPRKVAGGLDAVVVDDFLEYQRVLNAQLRAGDFFLCASEKQRDYWLGMLTANQRVNPHNYAADETLRLLIDVLPFGISSTPPQAVGHALKGVHPGIAADDKVIVWAGGIWDWFDPVTLVQAMPLVLRDEPRARLFFMGTRHPNAVVPPSRKVAEATASSRALGLLDSAIFFNDWVAYDQRAAYLLDADLGTSIHLDHLETRFSFRTRLLDYIWAGLPMVISGGDSISEFVAAEGLGQVLPVNANAGQVAAAILAVLRTPRTEFAGRFAAVQPTVTWDRVAAPLLRFAAAPYFAADRLAAGQSLYPSDAERVRTDLEQQLERVVTAKDEFTAQVIRDKDELIGGLELGVAEQQAYTAQVIRDKDELIGGLELGVAEQQAYTAQVIRDKDAFLTQVVADKDAYFERIVGERDAEIARLQAVTSAQAEEIGWRAEVMARQENELHGYRSSRFVQVARLPRRLADRLKQTQAMRQAERERNAPIIIPAEVALDKYVAHVNELEDGIANLLTPFVTVVIVNYNGLHFLEQCLSALANDVLDYPAESYEVVMVDNASRDGSVAYVRERYPWVQVVANERNLAFAAGNNEIMQAAPGEFVVLLNNDTRVESGWLRELLAAAVRHPQAAALTSKLLFYYRRLPLTLEASSFNPAALDQSGDGRDLGVMVLGIEYGAGVQPPVSAVEYGRGYYPLEGAGAAVYRWTAGAATAYVPFTDAAQPLPLTLRLNLSRPPWAGPLHLRLRVGDTVLAEFAAPEDGTIHLSVPPALLASVPEAIQNVGSLLLKDGSGRDRGAVVVGNAQSYEADAGQYEREEEVFAFCGAGVLLRTAALKEVGYFDDHFFMYYEDTDLSWRLRLAGWQVWYVPKAVVRHIHAGSSKEWSPFFTYHVLRNRLFMLAKLAPAPLARREWRAFLRHSLRAYWQAYLGGQRTYRQQADLQGRVVRSLLASLPRLLAQRRRIKRAARVSDRQIRAWTTKGQG